MSEKKTGLGRGLTSLLGEDISKNEIFQLSFLDELWQAENWGFDEETSQKRKEISIELNKSISFLDCL